MKRILVLITVLFSLSCFSQEKKDSVPLISYVELEAYLNRVNLVAMKQFNLTEQNKYEAIRRELLAILAEAAEKKKK